MTAIGPYRFTDKDVERTLANGRTLFDLLPGGVPPDPASAAAAFRARAEAALDDADRLGPAATLQEVWTCWRGAIEALRVEGAFGPSASGTVAALFLGDGGVPKAPAAEVTVDWSGVVGDTQGDRRNHGRPWQALCIWSGEVVDALAADGHPIFPGAAGENISVRGVPWERFVPGARLQVGSVVAEISSWSLPCKANARWFRDGHFDVMHHRHGPVSRVYATVLTPGAVSVGDQAVLEPGAS